MTAALPVEQSRPRKTELTFISRVEVKLFLTVTFAEVLQVGLGASDLTRYV